MINLPKHNAKIIPTNKKSLDLVCYLVKKEEFVKLKGETLEESRETNLKFSNKKICKCKN